MASQGPNNTYKSGPVPGQPQMRRDEQHSNIHSQDQATNFLQETGTQVKNMAQGAADVGKGAAMGTVNIARGAALGAANMAQGAADAVKNTIGMNTPNTDTSTASGDTATSLPGHPNTRI